MTEDRPDAEQDPKKRRPEFSGYIQSRLPPFSESTVPSAFPRNCFFATMQILDPPRPIKRACD
jgi:hypothetical protein